MAACVGIENATNVSLQEMNVCVYSFGAIFVLCN